MPELRQLRTFVAVAEELNFTRAAMTLGVKQQTVSKSIRDLENELGVTLLERTTREVRLTDAGLSLLEPARESLRQLEAALGTARAVGEGHVGTVRIGTSPSIGGVDTVDIARAIRSQAAAITLVFRELQPSDIVQALRSREIDIALTRTVGRDDPGLHRAELRPTPAAVFVGDAHRLAADTTASLDRFDGDRLLAANAVGTPYTDLLVARFAAAGAAVQIVQARVTGGSASMLSELAGTDMVAVKPAFIDAPAGVVRLRVEDLTVPLHLLWPAGLPSRAALWLKDTLGRPAP